MREQRVIAGEHDPVRAAGVGIVDDRAGDVPGGDRRAHVVDVRPLDHQLDAGVDPRLAAVLQHDRQLGKEAADVVDRKRVLVLARHPGAREADVEAHGDAELSALGVHRVVRGVVVVQPGLQSQHPYQPEAVDADELRHEANRLHPLARVDNVRQGEAVRVLIPRRRGPLPVAIGGVARAQHAPGDPGLVHLVDELLERRAPGQALRQLREQVRDILAIAGRADVGVDPGIDHALGQLEHTPSLRPS